MNKLNTGEYYGSQYQKSVFQGITITDTEYTHQKVDWHYHENPYFTFLLAGKLFESNKKKSYHLQPGSLLFHNWQDAHYNIKPPEYTRGFHIELNEQWLSSYAINIHQLEGSFSISNPLIKSLMNSLFIEFKFNDPYSRLSIEMLLLDIFGTLKGKTERKDKSPLWIRKLQEMILEEEFEHSLKSLSACLDIHPTHLSRAFSKHFGTSLGKYIRLIKINKAISLMFKKQLSMTTIAHQCGYYDQSHFISSFRQIYDITPTAFMKKI